MEKCPECSCVLDVITRKIKLLENAVEEYKHYFSKQEHKQSVDNDREEYYIASSNRNKFHRPTCEWADYLNPNYCPTFVSRTEAIEGGYKPCGTCCS